VYLANQQIVGPINLHDALDGHAIPHFVMERQFSQTAFAEFRSARRAVLIRLIESATGQTISAGELAQTIEGAGEDVADEVA
jgi:hypothetical protein